MTNVTATASGGASYGAENLGSSPTIRQSKLSGNRASLSLFGGSSKVADTQLVGPVTRTSNSTLQCFNNYNENMAAVTCP
jgi:hypothetical protein